MYEILPVHLKREFLGSIVKSAQLSLPDYVEHNFQHLIEWLDSEEGINQTVMKSAVGDLDSPKPVDIAKHFWMNFPQHFLRNYHSLAKSELECCKQGDSLILDSPIIKAVDVGCGSGSFTLAVLSLLIEYQKFKLTKNLPLFPVSLIIMGIEMQDLSVKIYSKTLGALTSVALQFHIALDFTVFPGKFEEAPILGWIESVSNYSRSILFGFSNLIRPISNQWKGFETRLKIIAGHVTSHKIDLWGEKFVQQAEVLREIISSPIVDRLLILIVASSTKHPETGERNDWETESREFAGKVKAHNQPIANVHTIAETSIAFDAVLPSCSYWKIERNQDSHPGTRAFLSSLMLGIYSRSQRKRWSTE